MNKKAVSKIAKVAEKKIKQSKNNQSPFGIKLDRYINEPKSLNNTKKQKLKLIHWNVNGLRSIAKKGVLEQFFTTCDIICLSETKIDLQKLKQESVHLNTLWYGKFNQYWSFSTVKKGYSGCVVFSKLRPLKVQYGIGIKKFDDEGRFTIAEFENFYLVNVYVPNSKRGLLRLGERVDQFDLEFRNFLDKLKQKKMLVVVGDFNVAHQEIDIADPKNNKKSAGFTDQERQSFDKLLDKGFIDVWRKNHQNVVQYSWWSNLQKHKTRAEKKGWRIDYCLVNNDHEKHVVKTELLDQVMGSDHCPMEVHLQFQSKEINKDQNGKQEINNTDQNDTNQNLQSKLDQKNNSEETKNLTDQLNKKSQENLQQNNDQQVDNQQNSQQENKQKNDLQQNNSNIQDQKNKDNNQNSQQNQSNDNNKKASNSNQQNKQQLSEQNQLQNNSITFQNFQSENQNISQEINNLQSVQDKSEDQKKRLSDQFQTNKAYHRQHFSFSNNQKEEEDKKDQL